jgi:cardiolipin synthase
MQYLSLFSKKPPHANATRANGAVFAIKPAHQAHQWRLFDRSDKTWDAMYADCKAARISIEFEQYILENDVQGQRFMQLFIEKAQAGLKVFLICDRFGSAILTRSPLVRELRQAGGRVHFYNHFTRYTAWMPWRWFPRTHVKTLLIDSRIAYIGGVCIAERMRHWRDTHIRLTGPVIAQVRHAFNEIENKIMHRSRRMQPAPPLRDGSFTYLYNKPLSQRRHIYRELLSMVHASQHYVYITSAYFIPNRTFVQALAQAVSRGVDVRVLVPARSDVLLADWVCLSHMSDFFKAGIRIYHYKANILHSKTAICDDSWATIGSTNFDMLSFFHNREGNIMTHEPAVVQELKQHFARDIEQSEEMTSERYARISGWKKAVGWAARGLKLLF